MDNILERHDWEESNIDWWEEARGQVSTMNFLLLN